LGLLLATGIGEHPKIALDPLHGIVGGDNPSEFVQPEPEQVVGEELDRSLVPLLLRNVFEPFDASGTHQLRIALRLREEGQADCPCRENAVEQSGLQPANLASPPGDQKDDSVETLRLRRRVALPNLALFEDLIDVFLSKRLVSLASIHRFHSTGWVRPT
jgi:hypothetical protein